jgi:hypothetical protein
VKLVTALMIMMMSLTLFAAPSFADDDSSEARSSDQQDTSAGQRTGDAQALQKGATDPQNTPPAGKFAATEAGFVACYECRVKAMAASTSDDYCSGGTSVSLTAASFGSQNCMKSGGAAGTGPDGRVNK